MPSRCCEFVDNRLRRSPQASQHAATVRDDFDFGGMVKSAAGATPLAYSSPKAVQTTGSIAHGVTYSAEVVHLREMELMAMQRAPD
jgi:hypothetical protein